MIGYDLEDPDLRCCECRIGYDFHTPGACDVYVMERCNPFELDYIENYCSKACRSKAYPNGPNYRCHFELPEHLEPIEEE